MSVGVYKVYLEEQRLFFCDMLWGRKNSRFYGEKGKWEKGERIGGVRRDKLYRELKIVILIMYDSYVSKAI